MKKILRQVLQKIVPTPAEMQSEQRIARELEKKIKNTRGKHVFVQMLGSLARNTHLKEDRDIDLFVFFPKKLSRKQFEQEGLRIGKKILQGHFWEEAYSEHPYIRGNYKGFDVEIVPAYRISGIHQKQSSVDRTPFHHQYLEKKMKKKQHNEVRLLKKFLKGIQAYGADTHYNGLSGYATELLTLKYGLFEKTLKAMATWKKPALIDIEKYWKPIQAYAKFPNAPLLLIDPIDANRNVAAALSHEQFQRIQKAAKKFLKKPSIAFFFPPEPKERTPATIEKQFRAKQIIGILLPYPSHALSDIIWGQIKKLAKKTESFFGQSDFSVKRFQTFTDEKENILLLFELNTLLLSRTKKRIGPPIEDTENVKRFLQAHPKSKPRTEKGRIVLDTPREITRAQDCLQRFLKTVQQTEKEPLGKSLQKPILVTPATVKKQAGQNKGLRQFVSLFLQHKKT